jgi:hypothetical protein
MPTSELFSRGARREVADDRQMHLFAIGGFDQEVNPTVKERKFHQAEEDMFETIMKAEHQCGGSRSDDQPGDEEIECLERVEANANVPAKPLRGENDDGRDDAEHRNVAQDRGGAIAHTFHEFSLLRRLAGLGLPAILAEPGGGVNLSSAIGAKRQKLRIS